MMMRVMAASLVLIGANLASAQPVTVRGRVVSETGAPVRSASVSQNLTVVRTDADGRFAIDVSSGSSLTVSKSGFVRQSFRVVPGELLVTLARGGVLAVFVIDASGKPVARASVTVTCSRSSSSGSPTDDRGQRRFPGLAPGRCEVSTGTAEPPPAMPPPQSPQDLAARGEELRARSEKQRAEHLARATAVDIRAGEETSIVLVGTASATPTPMPPSRGNSVISGTIVDEFGEPAEDVIVQVQPVNSDGQPPIQLPPTLPPQFAAQLPAGIVLGGGGGPTDDRGQFRVTGLPAGSYRVSARWGRVGPAPPVYYPGRREVADATVVTVAADAETSNVDFAMTSGAQGVVVGHVVTSDGKIPAGATAQLVAPATTDTALRLVASGNVSPEGQFTLGGVAPGTYDLQVVAASSYVVVTQRRNEVLATPALPSTEFGRANVTVSDANPVTLSIRTAPGASLRGRIDVEGDRGPLKFTDIRLVPAGDLAHAATVAADGTFDLRNLYGETRMALTAGASGWWLKSFMVGGVNAADDPVDFSTGSRALSDVRVVLARTAVVSGTVANARAPGRVVAFPVEPDRRYSGSRFVRTTTIGSDGRYTLDVPPGQYWLVALEGAPSLTEAIMVRLQSMSMQIAASDTRATQADLPMVRLPQ